MRAKTTLAQCLPADMEEKIVEFYWFVLRAWRCYDFQLSQILNMDETPMQFELPATRTLEFMGNRTVQILSCGGDTQSFTVVLAVKANGECNAGLGSRHIREHFWFGILFVAI